MQVPDYPNYQHLNWEQPLFIEGGDPFDYSSGYEVDGLPVSAAEFNRRAEAGILQSYSGPNPYRKERDQYQRERIVLDTHDVLSIGLGIFAVWVKSEFPGIERTDNSGGQSGYAHFSLRVQQRQITPDIIKRALATCVSQLYPHYSLEDFKAAQIPTAGTDSADDRSFNGYASIRDITNSSSTANIVADVTLSSEASADLQNHDAGGRTTTTNPWWTEIWTGPLQETTPRPGESNYPDLFASSLQAKVLRRQIHELGGALQYITAKYYPKDARHIASKMDPLHNDNGPALEECVGEQVNAILKAGK